MRLLICAGGTGGGVYPALAVLQELQNKTEGKLREGSLDSNFSLDVLWVGSSGRMESDLVQRAGVPFRAIPAAGVHGVGLRALPGNLRQLMRGWLAARQVLRQFQPDVLLFTGGFVAVPLAVASRLGVSSRTRPLIVLYVPDIEPGLALKALARFADEIALTVAESRAFFSGRVPLTVTGYPVRRDLTTWERAQARRALGLAADLPVVLVQGGSSGARSINRALLPVLPELLAQTQVIHLSGRLDWPEVEAARAGLPAELSSRYQAYPYLHAEMGAALAAADLTITRAGASVLGELPLFGLPAILVPYPYAWRYQQGNAAYLAQRGAAVIIADADLPARLLPAVQALLQQPERRSAMRQAMSSLARPAAAQAIGNLVSRLAGRRTGKGTEAWLA